MNSHGKSFATKTNQLLTQKRRAPQFPSDILATREKKRRAREGSRVGAGCMGAGGNHVQTRRLTPWAKNGEQPGTWSNLRADGVFSRKRLFSNCRPTAFFR